MDDIVREDVRESSKIAVEGTSDIEKLLDPGLEQVVILLGGLFALAQGCKESGFTRIVVILLGGGFALAQGCKESGFAQYLADGLSSLST
ncbi:hypothetical protein T484DRAFT_1791058 [Baffinella frigidus]|nr:hypothetical protein T484DRAFT_1791058 [Cryptophyta sp. CCMP2293]